MVLGKWDKLTFKRHMIETVAMFNPFELQPLLGGGKLLGIRVIIVAVVKRVQTKFGFTPPREEYEIISFPTCYCRDLCIFARVTKYVS